MIGGYIKLFFGFIAISAILYLPISFILKKKGIGFITTLSYLLCFWSFFIVIFTTIILFNLPFRLEPERSILNFQPLSWLWEGDIEQRLLSEIVPNIMIFIPLGFFIPIVFNRMRKLFKTALVIFFVTLSIEFFQYFIGRSSDIDDLFANLLGGIIGYGLFKVLKFYVLRYKLLKKTCR